MPYAGTPTGMLTSRRAKSLLAGAADHHGTRWRLPLALAIAFALGLLGTLLLRGETASSARQAAAAAAPAPPVLTVSVVPASRRSIPRVVVGDGSVMAWQELVLGAEIGGLRVVEVTIEEGDEVRRGDLLVRLEDAVIAAQRDQAEASVREAVAALRMAQQDLVRAVELARTQSAPRQTLEQRQAAAEQAEARLVAARSARDEAAARLRQTRILAPTDGVVSRRTALLGVVTSAGQEMIRLIRDGQLELEARVPELELAAIRPGQAVRVTHGERVIDAKVRMIAPTVGFETRLGLVRILLPPQSGLRPGMFAHAQILPDTDPVLAVPQEAVLFRGGQPVVLVLPADSDRVALRPIATGQRRDGAVEVTAGLAPDEQVIVHGAGFLGDGDRVRLGATAR